MYEAPKKYQEFVSTYWLFSLTVHIIKHIKNSEGEFLILNIKLNSFNQN